MSYDNDVQSIPLQALLLIPSQASRLFYGPGLGWEPAAIFFWVPERLVSGACTKNDYSGAPRREKGGSLD